MTHSGGKPHHVGDRGQKWEVTYYDPRDHTRKVFGWSNSFNGARDMHDSIHLHPVWDAPMIRNRETGETMAFPE